MPNGLPIGHSKSQEQTVTLPRLRYGALSDIGRERAENEDNHVIEPELALFVVSDGMGGHRGGALASRIVVEDLPVMIETRLHRLRKGTPRAIRSLFKRMIVEQNVQLRMEGASESGYKEMGATLAMTMLRDGRAYIANLGDSRIYRLRKGQLTRVTEDHSVVSELLRNGQIEPHEAENHHAVGQITHYIGMEDHPAPSVRTFALKRHDRLLLCTDGLTDMVDDKRIAAILRKQDDPQTACETLVAAANDAGGHDNITAVVVDWTGSS